MSSKAIKLNHPLPADVAAGSPGWWLAYRRYPVFSWPWVWRRALLFALFIVAWGALSGISHYAQGGTGLEAIQLTAWFVFGFGTVVNAGPILAAVVRHQSLAPWRESVGVCVALGLGLALAFGADSLSSSKLLLLSGESYTREFNGPALLLNLFVLLFIYGLLGGGLALRAYFSEGRRLADFHQRKAISKLEDEKLDADQQLALLQAQIEPHFLFNTLATIRSELRQAPEQAERTLDALCDYLRATIPRLRTQSSSSVSTLGEQFEICQHYLNVMQGRMRERLHFEIDLEPALAGYPFPPFLLLSLLENAIGHGLEPKPDGGTIQLEAERDGSLLCVRVIDSGVGLSSAVGHGVGLSNVRKQLFLRYGDAARLSLASSKSGGVEACIRLPWDDQK